MTRAFLISLRLYGACFIESFSSKGRQAAPLCAQRILLLLFGFPAFITLQLLHWLGFLLDEIFFSAYRRIRIEQPLFITGLPRSGTTFVHRTLAKDHSRFTSFRTWEAVLAPSITERKFWKALAAIDRFIGSPANRLLKWSVEKSTGDFSEIHAVGLDAEEEDYLALLPAGGCFILVLAFPWNDRLWSLARLSEFKQADRAALLNFYHHCLQKHLYVEGRGRKRLLSKNAAFVSWIPALQEEMSDARFLVCVRNPITGLSSQLSSIEGGCSIFGTNPHFDKISRRFEGVFRDNYAQLRHSTLPLIENLAVVDQEELRLCPKKTLENALLTLVEPLSKTWIKALDDAELATKKQPSGHQHSASSQTFAKATIEPCVISDYQAILQSRRNAAPPQQPPPASMTPTPSASESPQTGESTSQGVHASSVRIAVFSDALPERNGAGAYYHDLSSQLARKVERIELFQPTSNPRFPPLAFPLPGDSTQKLITPNVFRLWKQFNALKPHVVVAVTPGPFGILGLLLAKKNKAGFITAFHTQFEELMRLYGDTLFFKFAYQYLLQTNKILCRRSATVLVNNGDLVQTVEALGAPKVEIMGTPLSESFLIEAPAPAPKKLERILFAGRLAPEKNLPAVIQGATAHPDIEFIVAGDGPLKGDMEKAAVSLPNLKLTGWLDRAELRAEMDRASLLLLPSHLETFGTVALEAMARGRPALVAEGAGIHHWPTLKGALFVLEKDHIGPSIEAIKGLTANEWAERSTNARVAAEALNQATIEQWADVSSRYASTVNEDT